MIARIESHQFLREDSFSVKAVLDEIAGEIEPVAEDTGVRIKQEMEDDLQYKEANRSLIFSMFYNVVNNAVKNSPPESYVKISGSKKDNKFQVVISDTGKGLTEEQQKKLFLRFKMRDKDSGDGTGIGLAIAKTIADFHEISIDVHSEPGLGTKFSFIIPLIS